MSRLIARSITLQGEFKTFGLNKGRSEGTSVGITFDIPEDLQEKDLRLAVMEEKKRIDLMCITAEMLRGSITPGEFTEFKDKIMAGYRKVLEPLLPSKPADVTVTVINKAVATEVVTSNSPNPQNLDIEIKETLKPDTPAEEAAVVNSALDLDI